MKRYAVIVAATVLAAWTAVAQETPKSEVYLGFEHVRFHAPTIGPDFKANGGNGQFIYNFNSWFGGVLDMGAVHNGSIAGLTLDSTFASALAGPRLSVRKWSRFTPYFQVLWGGMYATSSTRVSGLLFDPATLPTDPPITARLKTAHSGFAMTAGGGLDIRISKHVAFRPFELDYFLPRFQTLGAGPDRNRNNLRYSTGFTFMFGGEKPAPPPPPQPPPQPPAVSTKQCPDGTTVAIHEHCPQMNAAVTIQATPRELCAGEKSQIVASASGAPPNMLNYAWTANGAAVGQGASLTFDSTGRNPGNYEIGITVNGNGINPANASTTVTVREYVAPTGTMQASPAQIRAGEKSSLTSSFSGQCGGPIQAASYKASEGSID